MDKFDEWIIIKRNTHHITNPKLYRERDIWWCKFGINIGDEEDGKGKFYLRPVIVIKGLGPNTCLVVPLTTSKNVHKYRIPVGTVRNHDAKAIISQIRVVDTRRFVEKSGFVDKKKSADIKKAIKGLL